jgi:hypothetical protein
MGNSSTGSYSPQQLPGSPYQIGLSLEGREVPTRFGLAQNWPNPFNLTTTIQYELPVGAWVSLRVYDVLGRETLSLIDGFVIAGYHQVELDAGRLASGVYFYRLTAGTFAAGKKMVVTK